MDIGRAVRCAHWSFCIRVALFIVVLWAEKLRIFKARRCERRNVVVVAAWRDATRTMKYINILIKPSPSDSDSVACGRI